MLSREDLLSGKVKAYKVTENGFTSIFTRRENVKNLIFRNVFDCEETPEFLMVIDWLETALIGESYKSPTKNFSIEVFKDQL